MNHVRAGRWERAVKRRVVLGKTGLGLRQSVEEDLFIHLFIHSLFNKYFMMGYSDK